MYICERCGSVFDAPDKKKYELCRIDGQPQYGYDHVCPCCGCPEFVDAEQCAFCGGYYRLDEFSESEENICKTCYHGKSAVVVA